MTTLPVSASCATLVVTAGIALSLAVLSRPIHVQRVTDVSPVLHELVAPGAHANGVESSPEIEDSPRDPMREPHRDSPSREAQVSKISFGPGRVALVGAPPHVGRHPVLINLHGMCNAPEYTCAPWLAAGGESSFVVCPTGANRCGADGGYGPYFPRDEHHVSEDVQATLAALREEYPGQIDEAGAVLTGFSRGGYLAVDMAKAHPGAWPSLVIVEADVRIDAGMLRNAGVRAIALVTGELSTQRKGVEKTAAALSAARFPSKLWIMPGAGHAYSTDIASIAGETLRFLEENSKPLAVGGGG